MLEISLLSMLAILAVAALYGSRARKSLYYYDVRKDSCYDFARANAREIPTKIHDGKMAVPARADARDTILAAVRVRATLLGHWFEPHVAIEDGERRLVQAFERGGGGLRYLNLSSLSAARDTSVRLSGRFLDIPDQALTLYYVANNVDPGRQRILVLSPHPDDAEIAAFGLYANRDAYVVTVTSGEGGGPEDLGSFASFGGDEAHFEKGRTRVWNSLTVPMLGGVPIERCANLGYFDGTLEAMHRHPDIPVDSAHTRAQTLDVFGRATSTQLMMDRAARLATWKNLVEDLTHTIRRVDPGIIVAPFARLDPHPDHKMSTAALLEALKKLDWNGGSLLLYVNHSSASSWYPYGRPGTMVSLPPGGRGVLFDGLLSSPLSFGDQQRKRVALDAMNDLRPGFPSVSPVAAAWRFLQTLKAAVTGDDQSYFRRAVRANELFFEVKASSLREPGIAESIVASAAS